MILAVVLKFAKLYAIFNKYNILVEVKKEDGYVTN